MIISEDLIKNEAEEYLENLYNEIDKYEKDTYEEVIKNIEFTNNDKRSLNSGIREEIVFNIDNKNSSKIKNVFIKLTSDNKTLNNRFYFIDDIKKFENKTVKIELKIPEWIESGNEKINFSLVKLNFNNILKPKLMELGNEVLDLEIKKSSYEFPELFYNIDLDPNQKELTISFDLNKTGQKCDECYLKIFSRDKNLAISQRNIKIENLSIQNFRGISKIKIREKNISEQIKFTLRFHDENTNDYFDKDIEINKSELLSYVNNQKPKLFIIKKRDMIYSEPSYSETILSNIKEGNLAAHVAMPSVPSPNEIVVAQQTVKNEENARSHTRSIPCLKAISRRPNCCILRPVCHQHRGAEDLATIAPQGASSASPPLTGFPGSERLPCVYYVSSRRSFVQEKG